MKKLKKTSAFSKNIIVVSRFFCISDSLSVIERQRTFVFLFSSVGFLIGILLNLLTMLGPQNLFIVGLNAVHAAFILLFVILRIRQAISLYNAVLLLILSIQIEIMIEMLYMPYADGYLMGIPGVLGNTTLLGILLILSITAYIRYLPYIQTFMTVGTLVACAYITKDTNLWHLIPVLGLAFIVLSAMGDRLVQGVKLLQNSKDSLDKEQDKIFDFLNMNKEELFKLIHLTQRKKLSDKQKSKLLELLDEHTKMSVLEAAAEVVEKKQRNLSLLDIRELGLTPYEKEVCLLILKEMTVADIAQKLGKTPTSITSVRASIRSKLKLQKEENLFEVLKKLVNQDGEEHSEKNPLSL